MTTQFLSVDRSASHNDASPWMIIFHINGTFSTRLVDPKVRREVEKLKTLVSR